MFDGEHRAHRAHRAQGRGTEKIATKSIVIITMYGVGAGIGVGVCVCVGQEIQ